MQDPSTPNETTIGMSTQNSYLYMGIVGGILRTPLLI